MEAFFISAAVVAIAEIGDKAQIATVALAARFQSLIAVIAGIGMLLANVPVVLFGDAISRRLPLQIVRGVAAILFLVLGLAALLMPSSL